MHGRAATLRVREAGMRQSAVPGGPLVREDARDRAVLVSGRPAAWSVLNHKKKRCLG